MALQFYFYLPDFAEILQKGAFTTAKYRYELILVENKSIISSALFGLQND